MPSQHAVARACCDLRVGSAVFGVYEGRDRREPTHQVQRDNQCWGSMRADTPRATRQPVTGEHSGSAGSWRTSRQRFRPASSVIQKCVCPRSVCSPEPVPCLQRDCSAGHDDDHDHRPGSNEPPIMVPQCCHFQAASVFKQHWGAALQREIRPAQYV